MKISEIIDILEKHKKDFGDVDMFLIAHYGEKSEIFEPMDSPDDTNDLYIWTDIMTG